MDVGERKSPFADEAERARQAAAADAVLLTTAAGSMALALVATTRADDQPVAIPHERGHEPESATPAILHQYASLFPPPSDDTVGQRHDPWTSGEPQSGPAATTADGTMAGLAFNGEHVDPSIRLETVVSGSPDHSAEMAQVAPEGNAPALPVGSSALSSSTGAPTGHGQDMPSPVISGPDSAGADLTGAIADLGADLQALTSSLVQGSLASLTDTITDTTTHLIQSTLSLPAIILDNVASQVLGAHSADPNAAATNSSIASDDAFPLLDTAGAVPLMFDLAPLQLGFLGQAHADGHDPHDGAFSALGIHLF